MTVIDQRTDRAYSAYGDHAIPAETEAQVRRDVAGASWFRLASITSQAHPRPGHARRAHGTEALLRALDRHAVLERLLAEAKPDRLHPPHGR